MRYQDAIVRLFLSILLTGLVSHPCTAGPVGSEFQVNTVTTSTQVQPVVALEDDGDFTVVWQSVYSIRSQRYASDGAPMGGETTVESFESQGSRPDLAMAPGGEFVVAWSRSPSNGTDTDSFSIAARRFGADGSPSGDDFQVNAYTTGPQDFARVAMGSDGDFVIVWQSAGSNGTDPGASVQGQRFASDGSFVGSEFQVNEWTTGSDEFPDVAIDSEGRFIVVWSGPIALGDDDDGFSIQARRFASDGTPVASQFQVNTYTTSDQVFPAVAYRENGDFVVVWNSYGSIGYTNQGSTQGQRFSSDGSKLGDQFQINVATTSYQLLPALATESGGDFVVAWSRVGSSGSDNSSFSVHSRRFAADATPLEPSQQVNTYTNDLQLLPSVAASGGRSVVVWHSNGSSGTDTDSMSIQGQRFGLSADLAVTMTDGVLSALPGSTLVYELEAVNEGPDGVSGVLVRDDFPAALDCSWTSVASGGAKGNTASAGDLADALIMPAGSRVDYSVTCGIDGEATGTLSNTATISSTAPDPNSANDSAGDETILVDPQVVIQVDVTQPSAVIFDPTSEPSALEVSGISGFEGLTLVGFFDGNVHTVLENSALCGSVEALAADGGGDRLALDAFSVAPFGGGWTSDDLRIHSLQGDIDFSKAAPALGGEVTLTMAAFEGLPAPGTTGLVVAGAPEQQAIIGRWQALAGGATSSCLLFADGFESGNTVAWTSGSP
ncbi:MAG: DUF11 domain-containing protein [Holophagales bacterium]|nr:DUF11 domain-containing protein [Holophagales bacterium]